jgi:hypothetical protein
MNADQEKKPRINAKYANQFLGFDSCSFAKFAASFFSISAHLRKSAANLLWLIADG